MKKLVITVAVLCGLGLSSNISAEDTSTANIHMQGNVDRFCTLGGVPSITGSGSRTNLGDFDTRIVFSEFVTAEGRHPPKTFVVTYPQAMCNYRARLGLKSNGGGMKPGGTVVPVTGFTNVVHYSATATWGSGGPTTQVVTSIGPNGTNNAVEVGPRVADLVVAVSTEASSQPLSADGTPFTDILIVQLGGQL